MGRLARLIFLICAALAIAGCGSSDDSSSSSSASVKVTSAEATGPEGKLAKPEVEVLGGPPPTELVSEDIVKGTGAVVKKGGDITVNYVAVDYKTGKETDSSWARGEPYSGTLGPGGTLEGWKLGIPGMRVGGRRELILPPDLAYGGENVAVADSTLVYVIDLLGAHK